MEQVESEKPEKYLHHLYGASVLGRRFLCPGSARMERDLPDVVTEIAQEGIDIHKAIAEECEKNGSR